MTPALAPIQASSGRRRHSPPCASKRSPSQRESRLQSPILLLPLSFTLPPPQAARASRRSPSQADPRLHCDTARPFLHTFPLSRYQALPRRRARSPSPGDKNKPEAPIPTFPTLSQTYIAYFFAAQDPTRRQKKRSQASRTQAGSPHPSRARQHHRTIFVFALAGEFAPALHCSGEFPPPLRPIRVHTPLPPNTTHAH